MHKIPNLVFDFDSTLVTVESLEELAKICLEGDPKKDEVIARMQEITKQGMEGTIPYEQSFQSRIALVEPKREHMDQLGAFLIEHISPSVKRHRDFFEEHKDSIYIVSGGFMKGIYPVADWLGISRDHVYANELIFNDDGSFSRADTDNPLAAKGGKFAVAQQIALTHPVWVIGDGYTDYESRGAHLTDRFFAYTETARRPRVVAIADAEVASMGELVEFAHEFRTLSLHDAASFVTKPNAKTLDVSDGA